MIGLKPFLFFALMVLVSDVISSDEKGTLEILVEHGLLPRETGLFAGSRDGYVVVYVNNKYRGRTRSIEDNHSPHWNEVIKSKNVDRSSWITFTLWDKDYFDADDFMGAVPYKMSDFFNKFQNSTSIYKTFNGGFLQFKPTFYPNKETVPVITDKVRNLTLEKLVKPKPSS